MNIQTLSAEDTAASHRAPSGILVNGRFLSQRTSGVQRFARELVKAVDAQLAITPPEQRGAPWTLLMPAGVQCDLDLRCIKTRQAGFGRGHLWDQSLHFVGRRGDVLVNLANSGPIWRSRNLVVIHDATVYRTPGNFTRAYAWLHQTLGHLLAMRANLATVSQFSRREIAEILGVDAKRIPVVLNSCEHLRDVPADTGVLQRLGVTPQRYFVFLSSPAPNKNLVTALRAHAELRKRLAAAGAEPTQLVIIGAVDRAVFGDGPGEMPEGAVLAGPVDDRAVKALLQDASALVFPSLYEGFGIPPLEAMLAGCPVIASDIPPVREVCGDAALRVPPTDTAAMAEAMWQLQTEPALRTTMIERGKAQSGLYAWSSSARALRDAIAQIG